MKEMVCLGDVVAIQDILRKEISEFHGRVSADGIEYIAKRIESEVVQRLRELLKRCCDDHFEHCHRYCDLGADLLEFEEG